MRTNKLHFFLLLLMCFCLNFSVQAEASIHIIKGKVTCEGKGIQGIMVTDGRICVQTDASGKYNIPTLGDSRFVYICCNLKYLIWLSTLCRKLAWERATDKKIPSCLESLYSSCFHITLFSWCKGSIFSWLPVIFGHKISRSFQETYTADMTAIP